MINHFVVDDTWTLFLDRDGVINKKVEGNYVRNKNEFEFLPKLIEALQYFSNVFGNIIIVTNQQGVQRGIMTEQDLIQVHKYMLEILEQNKCRIDKIYYCTDLAEKNPFNRKPNVGMALKAKKDFPHINFHKSFMIGDSISDMQFGKRMKMKTVFISDNIKKVREHHKLIDYNFNSVYGFSEFIKYIKSNNVI